MTDILINNVFWTFQGEGLYSGRRALFVRMPKCNLRCSWCDTEFDSFKKWSESDLIEVALSEKSRFAVITGGEPLMNRQTPKVVSILKSLGFEVACETNGTWPYVNGIDFVTCSPKRDADYEIHPDLWKAVDEFKYVIDKGFDLSVLERHNNPQNRARLTLSPEWNDFKENLSVIFDYIKSNPHWRISLQTHKIMEIA